MDKSFPAAPRVLVADDDEMIVATARAILAGRGYIVEVAEDGEECLAKALSFRPDLVILDIMMPKVHGMETLKRLKADPETRHIGVIICTGKKYKPDQEAALELGAFDVLLKPFAREDLTAVVNRYFSGSASDVAVAPAPRTTEAYIPRIPPDRCFARLWGTRGSIPVAGQRYLRHGGNTSCLEVGFGDESVIVDAGSGIRDLGLKLLHRGPRRVHLLITHTHWDHIQGFPFFAPNYVSGFEVIVYGATGFKKDLRAVLTGQLDRDYFPVQFDDMRARIDFRPLEAGLEIGGFRVSWEYTHHPAATVGFKFERDGKKLAYVSDNEFLYGYLGSPRDITMASEAVVSHRPLVEFLADTDLLIGEAQYFNEEYQTKVGWGHSSVSNACALAALANVKRWAITHHDPAHDDNALDRKLALAREVMRELGRPMEVGSAYDGLVEYW
jgi:CheY-like chemotaxis protein